MTKNLVSIAGYDPSAGAGVLLDIGVFERLGFRGFGILTAVTAQNPERVDRVFPLAAHAVVGQFGRLSETAVIAGIKVGMLATAENMAAVRRILGQNRHVPRVVDPVFRSSSGAVLLEKKAWPLFLDILGGKADLITPNLEEAEILVGGPVRSVPAMRKAAAEITRAGRIPCLLKGGHLKDKAVDVLYDGREFTDFEHGRSVKDVHGTGCFLSSAILGHLAEGRTLKEACRLGIALVGKAIREAVPAAAGRWTFDLNRRSNRGPSKGLGRR
ncbi:MAG: hydroxymethylpyrimidine/phosphomethylpyrimidine kinase [Candidatus Aminicenantes bacterium]|nr:hydroxymethylpyrimidine/phosphomethylpyrimidine kinase [Candidatus Aminicenantes bacterium]